MTEDDPSKGLEELIRSLRSSAPPAPEPPCAPAPAPKPEAPAPPPGAGEAGELKEFLLRRVAELEAAVAAERALRQEANRGTVDGELKALSELMRRERDESHSRGRIEALEARLDKMHADWTEALERFMRHDAPRAGAEVRTRLDRLAAALQALAARDPLKPLEARLERALSDWTAALTRRAAAAADAAKREELARAAEHVRFEDRLEALGKLVERSRAEMLVVVKRLQELGQAVEGAERRHAERLGLMERGLKRGEAPR